jgi:RNA polymerase sigma-70 factor (ECF subfamily)
MAKRTNEEWLRALRQPGAGQTKALEELRDYLLRAVLVYLRDRRTDLTAYAPTDLRELAEDCAQEALLSIRSNLDNFRGDAKFTTWAYRFVINQAVDELRRRRYKNVSLESLAEQEVSAMIAVTSPDAGLDPDLAAEREDFIIQLLDIIQNELNEQQRLAILAVHFQGRSMQEVAEQLETSPNTLYKILHDARKRIKAKLLARHLSGGDIQALFETKW